ncbi:hypothetical protein [Halomarina rubra]|uniref:DUF8108 domain-containing protein n=1 Tax=Halomarina rubra TaxID=2071873 RepID=A0ABD6AQC4_9EURY|nr:hypothetical protein [Halomarina rubra]
MARPRSLSDAVGDLLPIAAFVLPALAYSAAHDAGIVGETAGYALATFYVVVAVLANHREYSVSTFGWTRSVDTESVEECDDRCASCDGPVATGLERTYAEQFVAFGYPLTTGDWGENTYCAACATEEFPGEHRRSHDERDVAQDAEERTDELDTA